MTDPYKVLNVSPDASDEEVKKAYRALVKQYHPDNYADNPLADLAAEKMKEINEAYSEVQKMRASGSSSRSSSSESGTGRSSAFSEVRSYINNGRLSDAERLLNRTPVNERNAEWHFLRGVILCRSGWMQDGREEIETACRMDPYNGEYNSFLQRMSSGATQSPYYTSTHSAGCDICDICSTMMCLNCLCGGCR